MPRKPRFFLPDIPIHIVQRGNNKDPIFFDDEDHLMYLKILREGAEACGCVVHAYVLMTNHVHILASPAEKNGISKLMQFVGRKYVPYINRSYGRTGTLWEGRFKSSLIQEEDYLLNCMCYIEMNPVRAAMVAHPRDYRWSSYHYNALGKRDELITSHELYLSMDIDDASRRKAYRLLIKQKMTAEDLSAIRNAWQTGTPLGNDDFRHEVEKALKQKIGYAKRGRPVSK